MGTGFSLGVMKMSSNRLRWCLHNSVPIQKVTELCTWNWPVIWYVNCMSIQMFFRAVTPGINYSVPGKWE